MEDQKVVRQSVAFEPQDYKVVTDLIRERGLGRRGFSAAIRMIIREWQRSQEPEQQPSTAKEP